MHNDLPTIWAKKPDMQANPNLSLWMCRLTAIQPVQTMLPTVCNSINAPMQACFPDPAPLMHMQVPG